MFFKRQLPSMPAPFPRHSPMILLSLSLLTWLAAVAAQNGVLGEAENTISNSGIGSAGIVAIALTVVGFSCLALWFLPIPWRKIRRALSCSSSKPYRNVGVDAEDGAPLQEVRTRDSAPGRTPSLGSATLNAASQESLSSEDSQQTVRPQESESGSILYDPAQDPRFPDGKNAGRQHHAPTRFNVGALLGAGS
ncbi:hypothetical protein CALVIDRAFT_558860 [Calocera viscosa TUFC12733]|uniref:Transmembrane protein n=1 Tax=Calocera viscosa (strain TUFC12733) TaxID=1330018 RepID=A0A167G3G9_CALVF|nr:hypothetical protein CALVIDRAFT_558860 [Calocera viscosa TUFC12733]